MAFASRAIPFSLMMGALTAGAWHAPATAATPFTSGASLSSWLVVLKPSADAETPTADVPQRETETAQRERAHAVWQRQHARQVERLQQVLTQAGVVAKATGSAGTALRVDLNASELPDQATRRLRLHPDVLDVVPNERLRRRQAAAVTPNDTLWSQQWHLQPASTYAGAANLPAAWAKWTGQSKAVTVAVIDTGVRYDHPDLAGHLLPGYDFVSEVDYANDGNGRDADASDPGDWVTTAETRTTLFAGCDAENSSWHGTLIAGNIAAQAQNGVGVAGVNWGAQVVPVRVASKCGALLSDLLDGLRWAAGLPVAGVPVNANPARIINLSYGGSGACNSAYQEAINDVRAAGALVVVAAGNDGSTLSRPADCAGVLTVAGVRADGAKSSFSSYGGNVGLAAPGGTGLGGLDAGILSTTNTGTHGPVAASYDAVAGTSFSAPLVAGVASLLLGIQPAWTVAQLEDTLKRTARAHTQTPSLVSCAPTIFSQGVCNCTTAACGAGLLDASNAVAAALGTSGTTGSGSTGASTGSTTGTTSQSSGGGGSVGWLWGLGLWAWVLGVVRAKRQLARECGAG